MIYSLRGVVVCFAGLVATSTTLAESLPEALQRIVVEHPLAKAVANDVLSARESQGAEKSGWYPRLILRGSAARQHIDREFETVGDYDPREASAQINQLVWDFGAINATIARAEKSVVREERRQTTQISNLLLAGVEAYIKLLRAQRLLDHARQSEENIQRQLQLEIARMDIGKGYTTDLLQVKAHLAGAQVRRIAAEDGVEVALNRYKAVFGENVSSGDLLSMVAEPANMPSGVDEMMTLIDTSNPDVLSARASVDLSDAQREATRKGEWMPRIEFQAERTHTDEFDGVTGVRDDTILRLNASWQFDTGLRARRVSDAAAYAAASERDRSAYTLMQAREEGRNAWSNYKTAIERRDLLVDQVENSRRFLELTRQEREMGRRSLLDVLSGETRLINAQGDAAAAETDVALAAYRVLRSVGKLGVDAVRMAEGGRQ